MGQGLGRSGLLLCLIGPAGGGKTTFSERLLADEPDSMQISVSVTTRAARASETNGKSYHFVSMDEFERRVKNNEFFEHEKIHGHSYGTLKSTVDQALAGHKDLLLDIDIKGSLNFKSKLPNNTVIVFLAPPSVDILKSRLRGRGTISESEFNTRLATANREYSQMIELIDKPGSIDYLVVNDQAEETYALLRSIVRAERAKLQRFVKSEVRRLCGGIS